MSDHIVSVPASASQVGKFVAAERGRFERDLKDIRAIVEASLKQISVYKIYGRADKQDGDQLKQPRKIRLKFNKYFGDLSQLTGSLWTVPDIIGFTIVVSYPSDINAVCQILDGLITEKQLRGCGFRPRDAAPAATLGNRERPNSLIVSLHGRTIETGGYFACHYNVQTVGASSNRPICEIQIKTVLHDAWGAKSHDLTYKPNGWTSRELVDSFNLLGDTLAKIDQQSDLIRRSIERTASVRQRKKRLVQEALIADVAKALVAKHPDLCKIVEEIDRPAAGSFSDVDLKGLTNRLIGLFSGNEKEVCIALCLLSTRSRSAKILQQAQETIDTWYDQTTLPMRRVYIRSINALASYSGGDLSNAIDAADHAVELLDRIDRDTLTPAEQARHDRLSNSVLTSLAYYHADRIGSHEGDLGQSDHLAKKCLELSLAGRKRLSLLPNGLDSSNKEIEIAFADPELGWPAFSTLDSEAFVRIQTANSERDIRAIYARLEFIYKMTPPQLRATASLLFDYYDYCARARLAELESR